MTEANVELAVSLMDAPPKFHAQGHTNPDGWGVGCFHGGQASVTKHELPQNGELTPEQGSFRGSGSLFVSHVRRSSRAPRAKKNCHPFLHDGWLFAHNGALHPLLEKWVRKSVGAVKYEGQTESEALFRWVLQSIEKAGGVEAGIRAAIQPLVADGQFSSLNFLLARAGELYAFRYATRSLGYYSMYFLPRPAGGELDAASEDVHAHLRTEGLARQRAVLIATEKLSAEPWQAVEPGHLFCVKADLSVSSVPVLTDS
jgi:glutamine amidotransferase